MHDAEPIENPIPRGRRLVLVGGGQSQHSPARTEQDYDHGFAEDFGEEDTENLLGSVSHGEDLVEVLPEFVAHRREIIGVFQNLDVWNQEEIFQSRAHVMKTVPSFQRGGFRAAWLIALDEVIAGWAHRDVTQRERGWKFFFFLPRMFLFRACHGGKIPRKELKDRFQAFFACQWELLIEDSIAVSNAAATARIHKRRRRTADDKGSRAERLAMMGELSAARQALESSGLAPGDRTTLNSLRNLERRPVPHREPLPLDLDEDVFCRNLPVNISDHCSNHRETWVLSAKWPHFLPEATWFRALRILCIGRVTALRKPESARHCCE